MGTLPDPPMWLIEVFYLVGGLSLMLGAIMFVLARNPLPVLWQRFPSALAVRLQGLALALAGIGLLLTTYAFAQLRGHRFPDRRYGMVNIVLLPVIALLLGLAARIDHRSPKPSSKG